MKKPRRSALVDAFAADLKARKLSPQTVTSYMRMVRRFLRFVGNERPERIGDDTVRAFFQGLPGPSRKQLAVVVRQFLMFAATRCDVAAKKSHGLIVANPTTAVKNASELALRKIWTVDRLMEKQEAGDGLIAKLARKVIDFYLYLQ